VRLAAAVAILGVLQGLASPRVACTATLIHTNDVLGDIEPCGCRTNPQGGMARKANMMERLKDKSLLQLDAGDLLFSSHALPDMLVPQSEMQASFLLRSMSDAHHDAVVPGEKDFALGLKKFEKLIKGSKIKFLASNLVRRSGKPLFEPYAIFTRKSEDGKPLKIAVVGLVGDDLPFPHELKTLPAVATAKKQLAAVRKKADLVVFLTHEGLEKDQALAKAVPGIDIIIGGHTQSFLQEPIKVGSTMIYQSSFRNQYVGVLPLEKPFKGEGYKLIGLDAGYESPKDQPSKMDALVKEYKSAIGDLNSKEDAKLTATATPSSEGVKFQTFPKCAECHLKQFDFWRKTNHALALTPLLEKQQFKNKECLQCHTVGLGDPKGFSSVNHLADRKKFAPADASPQGYGTEEPAIETLATEDLEKYLRSLHDAKSLKDQIKISQADPEPQSIRRSLNTIQHSWTPVQCENCHQPGRDHPFSGKYSKVVEKTTCLNCHTAERAPEWYTKGGLPDWEKIQAKRAQITCPAGDLSESED
jgi:hypothetical protein